MRLPHSLLPFLAASALALTALAAGGGGDAPRPSDAVNAVERALAPADPTDDFGDTVRVAAPARRIVSLNPATTEILFAIGAGERLIGRSRWDEWPAEVRAVPALGDGIRPNVEATLAAKPDLVLLYASADNREAARALRAAGVATAAIKVDRLADFRRATRLLGRLTGDTARARTVVDSVDATLERVRQAVAGRARPRVVWPLFGRPLLAVGGGSFQHEVLDIAGGENAFGDDARPAVPVSREEVLRRGADVMLVGPTRVALVRADPAWAALAAVREGRVLAVDTNVVYRPAVRLGEAAVSLARLLHPEVAPLLADSATAARP
ncbi:helical backbone metal receptor [Roseisolibacter sp. H3M3-2]|uniref:ABC transporter substrate-binding protein n=1 Tax=Roseisolibacter sp. H3M3-2 TaxID=3031323 RepID=UPI0023DA6640|nr:helical backbone metal receptor [Roseisolibacter sp. H3M3-2]MDF1502265.1 helical backbone metal receptor [Roseisolibacter sp. H3M3-2]